MLDRVFTEWDSNRRLLTMPWTQLWRITVISPSGLPQFVEVRAATEKIAQDWVERIRPEWTIHAIERRQTCS